MLIAVILIILGIVLIASIPIIGWLLPRWQVAGAFEDTWYWGSPT